MRLTTSHPVLTLSIAKLIIHSLDHGTHTIDHLLVNDGLFNSVLEYYSLHEGTNLSFHSPIILTLHINVDYSSRHTTTNNPKPKWQESTTDDLRQYAIELDKALRNIHIPWEAIQCCDKSCTMHYCELQLFHDAIVKACVESGKQCIAHTSKSGKTSALTGWNEFVKPYRDDSIFWHTIWRQCGSPRNAVVADVMRRARKEYHNAVRALRLDQHQLHRQKVSQALLNNKNCDFWKEIRKAKGNCDALPSVIDCMSKDEDISDLFAKKYDQLYNSVSFDQNSMSILTAKIDELIDESPNVYPHVSVDDVVRGISQTKRNKKDSKSVFYTDHFINSNLQLRVFLSMLFSSLIVHGFTPNDFNEATIFPLIKNKRKSVSDSTNYRAIALSSPLAKLFDKIILHKYSDVFTTSDMQFGFKEHSSTTKCTFALTETVNYFRKNKSNVYVMLLDATKAFDKVNYVKLFYQLIDRGLNPFIIRCLLYMYTHQCLNVSWNNSQSKYFSTTNGVKQGGVLSPILFSVYIDELLTRLKHSGYGCMVGHVYCGAFAYADDIALVAPTTHALKAMCDICTNFAHEYDIQFNTAKCQLIKYGESDDVPFYFNGTLIEYVRHGVHLGHSIGPVTHCYMVRDVTRDFLTHLNGILANFNYCDLQTKYRLFVSYCTSYYGSCLWDLQHKLVDTFYTTWRKAIRRLFGLPRNAHCNLLPLVAACLPIQSQLLNRCANFVNSCLNSNNCILKLLSSLALQGSGSQMASNCNLIKYVYRINSNNIITGSSSVFRHLARNVYFAGLDAELLERAELLCDILWERDCEKTGDTQFMDFVIERLSAH